MLQSGPGTIGGMMIGAVISSTLFGVITVQTVQYFRRFSNDPGVTRALVIVGWTLQGLEVVFLTYALYTSALGNSFPSDEVIYAHPWNGTVWVLIGVVMSSLVQAFYAWRIYQLTEKIYLVSALIVLIVFKLGAGIAVAVLPLRGSSTWTTKQTKWVPAVWMTTDGVLDLTIVLHMFLILFPHRTGFSNTDQIINRMMRYSLQTGLVTSTVCIASVISYWFTGTGVTTVALNISAFSLYVMAMLANLHTRSRLRTLFKRGNSLGISVPLATLQGSMARSSTASHVRSL